VLQQVENAPATEYQQQVGGTGSLQIADALRTVGDRRILGFGCNSVSCSVEAKLAGDVGHNVFQISAVAPEPGLAIDILSGTIRALTGRYAELEVKRALRDQARLDAQLSRYREEQAESERRLTVFLESNRIWNSVPRLAAQADSLQRIVDVRRFSVATMVRSIEEAKIRAISSPQPFFIIEQSSAVDDAVSVPALFGVIRAALLGVASGVILLFGAFLIFGRDDIALLLRALPQRLKLTCEAWIHEIESLNRHVNTEG